MYHFNVVLLQTSYRSQYTSLSIGHGFDGELEHVTLNKRRQYNHKCVKCQVCALRSRRICWRWNDLWKLVKPTLTTILTSWDASCVRGDQNIHMWQRGAASVASSGLQMFRTWKWVSVQPRFDKQVSAWIRSINPTPSAEPAQTAVDETSSSCRVLVSETDVPGSVPWSPWDRQRSDTLFINSVQKRASSVRGPEAATCPLTDTSVLSSRLLSFFLNTSSSFCWRHADSKLPITNRKLSLCACACFWRTHEDITSPLRSFNCGSGNRTSKTKLKKEEKEAESTLLLAKVKKKKE